MELKPGLGGHAVKGLTSEIKIRLFSSRQISGEIEVSDANGLTKLPIHLDEHIEQVHWLPVTTKAYNPVEVRLVTDQGDVIAKKLVFEKSRTALTIIDSTIPVDQTLNNYHKPIAINPVIISATSLPHNPQAYAGVESIVIDQRSLSSLSYDQYQALSDYLSQCNIMLLSGVSQAVLKRLQSISGCSGRLIKNFEDLSQVSPILQMLSAMRPPKTPAAQELMSLQQTPFKQQMSTSISLYLAIYIFFISLFTWRMKKTYYLLLLPIIVATAGILIWTGEGSHHLINWAETESGDSYNRVSSLLMLGGSHRGENMVTLGTHTLLSNFIGESQYPSTRYLQNNDQRKLSGYTHLLSPQAIHLTSIIEQQPQFQLKMKMGQPEVIFLGEVPPAKTRLLWRGHTYEMPALSPGDRWQPDQATGQNPVSPAERLLNRHLTFGDPALLLPYSIHQAEAGNSDSQTIGWLIIRHTPEDML